MTIEGRYIEVQGTKTYFETCGKGLPILLIHTAGRDNRQWHEVMELLSDRFTLFAPDLPGHGKSWPIAGNTCLTDMYAIANWLFAFMDQMSEQKFIVMGCSIGGNLSFLLPALSDKVCGAIPIQGADYSEFPESGLQMLVHPHNNPAFSSMDFAMSLVGNNATQAGRDFVEWSLLTINAVAQHADLSAYGNFDMRDKTSDIKCPVLLVHGDEDWVVTREMINESSARLINAESVEVVSLKGLGHYVPLEDARNLIASVSDFLCRFHG